MSVGTICRRPACDVERGATAQDAALRMDRERVGALVVVEEGRPFGVVTDRDLALRVVARGAIGSTVEVERASSTPPQLLTEDLSLQRAAEELRTRGLRRAPVVDGEGRLLGMFTGDDLVRLAAGELQALADVATEHGPAARSPAVRDARQVRSAAHYRRTVTTVSSDTSARQVARRMGRDGVGCVVVVDDGRPCGIVTDRDLALRVTARDLEPDATPTASIMSRSPLMLDAGEPLTRVVRAMSENAVRRIPVTQEGRLVGIVTYDDVLVALGRELAAVGETAIRAREQEARAWAVAQAEGAPLVGRVGEAG
ncbi:MAG: CBS domain-containing protein [Myxococcota bacterium]